MSQAKKTTKSKTTAQTMLFGRKNFIVMIAGLALIFIGFLLMSGGEMPNPDTWDESIIYSPRRITLAPFVVLVGLGLQAYAIFRK